MSESKIAPCCEDLGNRIEVESRPAVNRANPAEKGTLSIQKCKVCSRKHYVLDVEPVKIGISGGSL